MINKTAYGYTVAAKVATTVHVLIVLDGRVGIGRDPESFGLGYVLDSLTSGWISGLKVKVRIVRRERCDYVLEELRWEDDQQANSVDPRFSVGEYGYRFDSPGNGLDSTDVVMLFGDQPTDMHQNDDSIVYDPEFSPLSESEIERLHGWMNRGGGLLAIGDHSTLGAPMCSRTPRVRKMRKWLVETGAPDSAGVSQLNTLNLLGPDKDELEGDAYLQQITLKRFGGILNLPHPIMRFLGLLDITHFPDHMHEGEVIDSGAIDDSEVVSLFGETVSEFPAYTPAVIQDLLVLPAIQDIFESQNLYGYRPKPQVVAFGTAANEKQFGLVGVYEGGLVNAGRIIVDSTWHHWFSWNLHTIGNADSISYRQMQTYYRNCLIWLLPKSVRKELAITWIAAAVILNPVRLTAGINRSGQDQLSEILAVAGKELPLEILFDLVDAGKPWASLGAFIRQHSDSSDINGNADIAGAADHLSERRSQTLLDSLQATREVLSASNRPSSEGLREFLIDTLSKVQGRAIPDHA